MGNSVELLIMILKVGLKLAFNISALLSSACAALKLFTYGCEELVLGWEISIVTRPTLPTSRQSMAPDNRK